MKPTSTPAAAGARPDKGDWPAIADKLGDLRTKLAPILADIKSDVELEDELTKEIRAKYDKAAADGTFMDIEGEHYQVIVEPRRREARINDMVKLMKRITRAVFFSICKISQEALKKTDLTEGEITKLLTWERTGWRPVNVVPKKMD
jgi:hypothetical protein